MKNMKLVFSAVLVLSLAAACHRRTLIVVDLHRPMYSLDHDSNFFYLSGDTGYEFLNYKPLVIIYDGHDTERYFFNCRDTLRYNTCQNIHDTVYLSTSTHINTARDVIIGDNDGKILIK